MIVWFRYFVWFGFWIVAVYSRECLKGHLFVYTFIYNYKGRDSPFMIGYTTRIISIDALRIDAVGRQRSAGFGQGWYGKIWEDGEVDVDVA